MPDLSRDLRRTLATVINAAREDAELGAADALRRLGVFESRRPTRLEDADNETRKRLRAHARSLGDSLGGTDGEPLRRLVEAAAYVQWHRLLFARFLLERDLLRDDLGVVTLADCRDEAGTGGDEWAVAASHTARMLPGVFPVDDPVEAMVLAPEHAKALRDHLAKLDAATFQADDSLGWTYQFWRAAEKDRVNKSGVKIGAAELPAVTQLFTEPYMVRFLLHNTLGAWWAGKVLAERPDLARDAADEAALRAACKVPGYTWDFLRFVREDGVWRPAAGVFPGWPRTAAAVTVLDPCCGSGHFLTEALSALAALRGVEEAVSPGDAVVDALRDNLHGLEIDGRCVQIAAFALALTAWRIGGAGVRLPTPHVAWVGGPPPLPKAEFAALANGDAELRRGLETLHDLFAQAPILGSLIEVTGGDLASPVRVARIESSIDALAERMRGAEPDRAEGALAARGMADAAGILARRFVLQVTNVPFLGRGKQDGALALHVARRFDSAKSDLATAMLTRIRGLAAIGGSIAAVTPQNWLFQGSYQQLRAMLLAQVNLVAVGALGPRCFETISGEVVNAALIVVTESPPTIATRFVALDANSGRDPTAKAIALLDKQITLVSQTAQSERPDRRISVAEPSAVPSLSKFADVYVGFQNGDTPRWVEKFWERSDVRDGWSLFHATPERTGNYEGFDAIIRWEDGAGALARSEQVFIKGREAWGRHGVLCRQTQPFPTSQYIGTLYDQSGSVIVPREPSHLPAMRAFLESEDFRAAMLSIAAALKFTNSTFVNVPFDLGSGLNYVHQMRIAASVTAAWKFLASLS